VLQRVAACCSVLQRVAVRCSALQIVVACCSVFLPATSSSCLLLEDSSQSKEIFDSDLTFVCCGMLHCVAVRSGVLQCVSTCDVSSGRSLAENSSK